MVLFYMTIKNLILMSIKQKTFVTFAVNYPWIYVDTIGGKDVEETHNANHGYCIGFVDIHNNSKHIVAFDHKAYNYIVRLYSSSKRLSKRRMKDILTTKTNNHYVQSW